MEAEGQMFESLSEAPESTGAPAEEYSIAPQRQGLGIMEVLMPAHPPEPKNARVIRLFDYEAAGDDPRVLTAPVKKNEQTAGQEKLEKKQAAKAARNQSLFTAAGLG